MVIWQQNLKYGLYAPTQPLCILTIIWLVMKWFLSWPLLNQWPWYMVPLQLLQLHPGTILRSGDAAFLELEWILPVSIGLEAWQFQTCVCTNDYLRFRRADKAVVPKNRGHYHFNLKVREPCKIQSLWKVISLVWNVLSGKMDDYLWSASFLRVCQLANTESQKDHLSLENRPGR